MTKKFAKKFTCWGDYYSLLDKKDYTILDWWCLDDQIEAIKKGWAD